MGGPISTAPSRNEGFSANSDSQELRLATGFWQLAVFEKWLAPEICFFTNFDYLS